MDEIKTKQQVVEKIKESAKILVTVSDSPSVDALSAALALTMLLDKQEKYATAIFSGETPPAIAFLEPEKTFDDTTDSLRDFIIALNKDKADHLRYKVEGDSVKIFITPYKTTIDQSDLEFSQGDYNVELVIALGVDKQANLDTALDNHGQILHDAAIITMTAGDQSSDLGGIDWHDSNSSSLSEMVAGLAEALKVDKKKPLLDEPIATALLTGIVAETDRFSNERTTAKAMTVSAALMAAGADQQLIANELQASQEIVLTDSDEEATPDDSNDSDVEIDKESEDGSLTIKKDHDASVLAIDHEGETLADLDRRVRGDEEAKDLVIGEVEAAELKAAAEEAATEATDAAGSTIANDPKDDDDEPALGGILNATTEQAADDARRAAESDQNKTILSHSYIGSEEVEASPNVAPASSEGEAEGFPGTPPVAPGSVGVNDLPTSEEPHSAYAPVGEPSIAFGGERVIQPLSEPTPAEPATTDPVAETPVSPEPIAESTVEPAEPSVAASAYYAEPAPETEPTAPNPGPVDLGLPLPPPIPDFSQMNGPPLAIPLPPTEQPEILGDILAPEPTVPFETLNAVPAPNTAYAPEDFSPPPAPQPEPQPQSQPQPQFVAPPAPQPASADPGQFQIPPAQ